MKLSFDITIDDVMAFYSHYYNTDSAIRKQLKQANIMAPAFFVLLGLWLCLYAKSWYPFVISGGLILFWFISFPRRNRSQWMKRLRKQMESSGSTTMFGERTLEFDDENMTVDMPGKVHETLAWNVFSKFEETDEYFFLYLSGTQAHVIPKRAMTVTQIEEFGSLLKVHNLL